MTIVVSRVGDSVTATAVHHSTARSASKGSSRAAGASSTRFSATRLRHGGNSSGAGHSTAGGHPLTGADPAAAKKEIKHRFEITAKLGSGTYGKVSLAFDHKMEREVAVKLIKKSAIENKQDLVRIRREIRIMSMLKHPNIIQIYEVFENKDKIILVMEYASGGELYDYVSKMGCLPEAEARRIFRQITSAVLYCHKHKVAHRDLKLENILLDASNNAKIADFGLSNYFSEKSLLSTFCGSPLYASPEIINGTPYRGPEVDCWSLGILLYTLVYGSMPFDGRDFNRMVRQIKRGAYYEPETPSTASMLIRNMLRVNSDRRADIDEIASHWWLNLEENMPVIQELPENQITDHTPLTERAEIMVVQDLIDETDVFMEFGHLSAATRRKIEEFRRRRKEAEEYNENSPIKPPKARRTSCDTGEPPLTAKEKSLRHQAEDTAIVVGEGDGEGVSMASSSAFQDPLKRLKLLESRLQSTAVKPSATPAAGAAQDSVAEGSKAKGRGKDAVVERGPAFISPTEPRETSPALKASKDEFPSTSRQAPPAYWRLETDSLNVLMNQVLEQMEKGPVSMNLLARVKQHPLYEHRPMVKELLESIIAAQPSEVQRETTKLLVAKQLSQDLVRQKQQSNANIQSQCKKTPSGLSKADSKKQLSKQPASNTEAVAGSSKTTAPSKPTAPAVPAKPSAKYQVAAELPPNVAAELRKALPKKSGALDERPWHSVEVGFSSTDSEESNSGPRGEAPESVSVAVRLEPSAKDGGAPVVTPSKSTPKAPAERVTRSEPLEDEYDEEYDDEEEGEYDDEEDEYYDAEDDGEAYESDIDELAEVVELIGGSSSGASSSKRGSTNSANATTAHQEQQNVAAAPKIVEAGAGAQEEAVNSDYLSTLERGLSKRQSKGKYLHPPHPHFNKIELYGRGVSTEVESPPPNKRRIGGPQPRPEHSPVLFDKAKNYLMSYPNTVEDSDHEGQKKKKPGSAQPKSAQGKATQSLGGDEEQSGEEEEEEEDEGKPFRPRPSTIIGFRTIQPAGADGVRKEAPIVQVKPQAPTTPVSSPATKTPGSVQPQSRAAKITARAESTTEIVATVDSLVRVNGQPHQMGTPITDSTAFPFPPSSPYQLRRLYKPACRDVSIELSPAEEEMAMGAGGRDNPQRGNDAVTKWESATSYIRRKARERRARNSTVAVGSDELWGIRQGSQKADGSKDAAGKAAPTRPTAPCESRIMRRRSSVATTNKPSDTAPPNSPPSTPPDKAQQSSSSPGYQSRTAGAGGGYFDEQQPRRGANRQQSVAGTPADNYSRQNYIDRRKSFHDLSPERTELSRGGPPTPPHVSAELRERYGLSSGGGSRHALSTVGLYGAGGLGISASPYQSSNVARYQDEVYNAFGGGGNGAQWVGAAREPNVDRFEVYRTRAERAAEANSYRPTAAGGTHRATAEHRDYDRPLSLYGSGIPGGTSTAYKSRFDDNGNFMYRRSVYEGDTVGGGLDSSMMAPPPDPIMNDHHFASSAGYHHGGGGYGDEDSSGGGILSRLKPVTRRLSSAFRSDAAGGAGIGGESRGRMRARSQSNDRLFSVLRGEADFEGGALGTGIGGGNGGGRGPKLMTQTHADLYTPAMMASAGAGGYGMPSFDFDPYTMSGGYGVPSMDAAGLGGAYGGSRLPRDYTSIDSSTLAPPMTPTRGILKNRQAYEVEPRSSYYGRDAYSAGMGVGRSPFAEIGAITGGTTHFASAGYGADPLAPVLPTLPSSIGANKKRSLLNLARRRTTEVRLLPSSDAGQSQSFLLDDELSMKRPRSPIDKIKSLFRSSGFTGGRGGAGKTFGSGHTPSTTTTTTTYLPSSTTTSAAGRSYMSQIGAGSTGPSTYGSSTYYQRYGASGNGGAGGYAGYTTRGTRNWHDDGSN